MGVSAFVRSIHSFKGLFIGLEGASMRKLILTGMVVLTVIGCGKSGTSGSSGAGGTGTSAQTGTQHVFEGDCDLMGTPFGGGAGTGANPYLICSAAQLMNLSNGQYATASFILVKNLDLTDAGQMQFSDFSGTFDGNFKTLSNLKGGSLFDTSSGVIKNLTVTGADISGSYRAGILVGWHLAGGQIINCHVSGKIATSYHTGGLVGFNEGSISKSSASVSLSGADHMGGFVGVNKGTIDSSSSRGSVVAAFDIAGGFVADNYQGTITNCYSLATVQGRNNIGGFFGTNEAGVVNAFSAGAVAGTGASVGGFGATNTGTVTASFWDTVTSGKAASAGGTGHTTAEMQTLATYAGWDFAAIWDLAAASYPTLR